LVYGKTGWSRYLSHLEVIRLIQRAFRRAGIKLAYSEGFHPHPKISFGPALPVGVDGEEEYLDFLTTVSYDTDRLRSDLAAALPDSFPVHDLREIPLNATAIEKTIDYYRYYISFPDDFSVDLVAGIQEKLADNLWPITRKTNRGVRQFDARPYIIAATKEDENSDGHVLLELRNIEGRTVKPTELIESLLGELPPGMRIVRQGMGKRVGERIIKPLDV
jgi:radical SAM-linked protein